MSISLGMTSDVVTAGQSAVLQLSKPCSVCGENRAQEGVERGAVNRGRLQPHVQHVPILEGYGDVKLVIPVIVLCVCWCGSRKL